MEGDKLVQLDPAAVLAEDNARFSLANVEELAESIEDKGGVLEPVAVEVLKPAVNGHTHKLIYGFRRHAAVLLLNQSGAGLTLPALLRTHDTEADRLASQLTENIQRQNLSPMDTAIAIQQCQEVGMTREAIRELFKRPAGTKKGGISMQPASNAWVNMMLSFLELPKPIQAKIHSGVIGVAAAYKITKVTPEKRAQIVTDAEAEIVRMAEAEAKDEERFNAAQTKVDEAVKQQEETKTALEQAKANVETAEALVAVKVEAAGELHKAALKAPKEEKKPAQEKFKAAEKEAKDAENALAKAKKEYNKLTESQERLATKAADSRAKLEAARKASAATKKAAEGRKKTIGAEDIQKAARKAGEEVGRKVLSGAEMRKVVDELSLDGSYPKVAAIGAAFKSCFDSVTTQGQLYKALAAITGELSATSSPASSKTKGKK